MTKPDFGFDDGRMDLSHAICLIDPDKQTNGLCEQDSNDYQYAQDHEDAWDDRSAVRWRDWQEQQQNAEISRLQSEINQLRVQGAVAAAA